jgi:hypothetical protein
MPITMNPFALGLTGYLQDMECGIAELNGELSPAQYYSAVCRLCELSRNITFSLGPPAGYERDYIDVIVELLSRAARAINPGDNEELAAFKNHIYGRAESLRDEYNAALALQANSKPNPEDARSQAPQ